MNVKILYPPEIPGATLAGRIAASWQALADKLCETGNAADQLRSSAEMLGTQDNLVGSLAVTTLASALLAAGATRTTGRLRVVEESVGRFVIGAELRDPEVPDLWHPIGTVLWTNSPPTIGGGFEWAVRLSLEPRATKPLWDFSDVLANNPEAV